jgi:hypothetical protein
MTKEELAKIDIDTAEKLFCASVLFGFDLPESIGRLTAGDLCTLFACAKKAIETFEEK